MRFLAHVREDLLTKSSSFDPRRLARLSMILHVKDHSFLTFLDKLLAYEPKERLTPLQALCHPFLTSLFPAHIIAGAFLNNQVSEGQTPRAADVADGTSALASTDIADLSQWSLAFSELCAFVSRHGGSSKALAAVEPASFKVIGWLRAQARLRREGLLEASRLRMLESLPIEWRFFEDRPSSQSRPIMYGSLAFYFMADINVPDSS